MDLFNNFYEFSQPETHAMTLGVSVVVRLVICISNLLFLRMVFGNMMGVKPSNWIHDGTRATIVIKYNVYCFQKYTILDLLARIIVEIVN